MQEIKIRAWDLLANAWYQQVDDECICDINHKTKNGELIIEQFTGLLDSKGREIYEGDIVVAGEPTNDSVAAIVKHGAATLIEWEYDGHKEYNYYGWYLDGLIDCNSELIDGRLTIIGNIHESE